jgi:hypothetical protein
MKKSGQILLGQSLLRRPELGRSSSFAVPDYEISGLEQRSIVVEKNFKCRPFTNRDR